MNDKCEAPYPLYVCGKPMGHRGQHATADGSFYWPADIYESGKEVRYLKGLLAQALEAISEELYYMGEDEWRQQPSMVAKNALCDRIAKALGDES